MSIEKPKIGKNLFSTACVFAAILAFAMFFCTATVFAHGVNVFAYVEGKTVITESYFKDGHGCRDAGIEVFDSQGKKLLEGRTDAEGRFAFDPPTRTDLMIRLTASMGHQAEYVVPAADLPMELPSIPGVPAKAREKQSGETVSADKPGELSSSQSFAPADIEKMVEKAVARQLAPIRRSLEESQRKQRFSDIVGGIGYILGLMGVALYFYARQRRGQR